MEITYVKYVIIHMGHNSLILRVLRYVAWIALTFSIAHILGHIMTDTDMKSLDYLDLTVLWFFSAYTAAHLAEID